MYIVSKIIIKEAQEKLSLSPIKTISFTILASIKTDKLRYTILQFIPEPRLHVIKGVNAPGLS